MHNTHSLIHTLRMIMIIITLIIIIIIIFGCGISDMPTYIHNHISTINHTRTYGHARTRGAIVCPGGARGANDGAWGIGTHTCRPSNIRCLCDIHCSVLLLRCSACHPCGVYCLAICCRVLYLRCCARQDCYVLRFTIRCCAQCLRCCA